MRNTATLSGCSSAGVRCAHGWHDSFTMMWGPAALIHGAKLSRGKREELLAAMGVGCACYSFAHTVVSGGISPL